MVRRRPAHWTIDRDLDDKTVLGRVTNRRHRRSSAPTRRPSSDCSTTCVHARSTGRTSHTTTRCLDRAELLDRDTARETADSPTPTRRTPASARRYRRRRVTSATSSCAPRHVRRVGAVHLRAGVLEVCSCPARPLPAWVRVRSNGWSRVRYSWDGCSSPTVVDCHPARRRRCGTLVSPPDVGRDRDRGSRRQGRDQADRRAVGLQLLDYRDGTLSSSPPARSAGSGHRSDGTVVPDETWVLMSVDGSTSQRHRHHPTVNEASTPHPWRWRQTPTSTVTSTTAAWSSFTARWMTSGSSQLMILPQ